MFWNRSKEVQHTKMGPVLFNPSPPLKEYDTFLDILRDAEKYQRDKEPVVEKAMLGLLMSRITEYMNVINQADNKDSTISI